MKLFKKIVIITILIGLFIIVANIIYLLRLAPNEKYPEDKYLQNETKKIALIVVAHDDDAAPFSGTISLLAASGWNINFVCFYNHQRRPEENSVRRLEMKNVAKIEGLKNIELIELELRNRLDTIKQPWMPIPYIQFSENFKIDSLKMFVLEAIKKYKPTVIFTLDDVIGTYGHPEHVLVSRLVKEMCLLYKDTFDFSVKKIYQSVTPASQAEKTIGDWPSFKAGKKIYNCNGIPTPDLQINISSFEKNKKKIFLAHASQNRNLKKFFPCYQYYPGWLYFRILNKNNEYFRKIDLAKI